MKIQGQKIIHFSVRVDAGTKDEQRAQAHKRVRALAQKLNGKNGIDEGYTGRIEGAGYYDVYDDIIYQEVKLIKPTPRPQMRMFEDT